MTFTLVLAHSDARRSDLIEALRVVLGRLENTGAWSGITYQQSLTYANLKISGQWEVE